MRDCQTLSVPRRRPLVLDAIAEDGTSLRLVTNATRAQVDEYWPPLGLRPDESLTAHPIGKLTIDVDDSAWSDRMESELSLFATEHLCELVAVHAAVLRVGDRLIIVPGPSHTGKSELCSAAAEHPSVTVLSDEYALVDPDTGLVRGWPRAVRIRVGPSAPRDRLHVVQPSDPMPVGLVAAVSYDKNLRQDKDSALLAADLTPSSGALELLANTVCASVRPEDSFRASLALARGARCVAGRRGDAAAALPLLMSLLVDGTGGSLATRA